MSTPVTIMPCLDMQNGRVVKGIHFVDIADAGDPVECAKAYCTAGADELALLDITATVEKRGTLLDVVKRVSAACTVPFTVGGGICDVKSAGEVLTAGANTVSVSSAAFRNPEIIPAIINEFGRSALTVAIDVDVNPTMPSGYEVYIDGGRTATGYDAIEWAKKVDGYGVEVILPTSKAGDGAKTGYDLPVISNPARSLGLPLPHDRHRRTQNLFEKQRSHRKINSCSAVRFNRSGRLKAHIPAYSHMVHAPADPPESLPLPRTRCSGKTPASPLRNEKRYTVFPHFCSALLQPSWKTAYVRSRVPGTPPTHADWKAEDIARRNRDGYFQAMQTRSEFRSETPLRPLRLLRPYSANISQENCNPPASTPL